MIEAVAKRQLMNDIEKLDPHSDHDRINTLRSRIEPILVSRYPTFDGTNIRGTPCQLRGCALENLPTSPRQAAWSF